MVVTLASGTDSPARHGAGRAQQLVDAAGDFHGPPTDPAKDRDLYWRIKAKANGVLRQEFLDHYMPKILELGLTIPDAAPLQRGERPWEYTEPDWSELKTVVTGHGPRSAERLTLRRMSYADTEWVRDVVLARRMAA